MTANTNTIYFTLQGSSCDHGATYPHPVPGFPGRGRPALATCGHGLKTPRRGCPEGEEKEGQAGAAQDGEGV